MDPQTTNQPNQPAATPPQAPPAMPSQPVATPSATPTPSDSKMPRIIAGIVGGLLVIGGIIFALLFYPQMHKTSPLALCRQFATTTNSK